MGAFLRDQTSPIREDEGAIAERAKQNETAFINKIVALVQQVLGAEDLAKKKELLKRGGRGGEGAGRCDLQRPPAV